MQALVSNVGFSITITKLIGRLYNEAKLELSSTMCNYDDYVALGRAYKSSLDLRKHGDKVELPPHLWERFADEKLRALLTSSIDVKS